MGKSGRQMLKALMEGSTDTSAMAQLAKGGAAGEDPAIGAGSAGMFRSAPALPHCPTTGAHRLLQETIEQAECGDRRADAPFRRSNRAIGDDPGVGRRTAEAILAEIGPEMSRFPTVGTWPLGRGCVRATTRAEVNAEAGRPPRAILAAGSSRGGGACRRSYEEHLSVGSVPQTRFPSGQERAAVAVGHSILVIAYHLLERSCGYEELGGDYFDKRDRQGVERRLVRRLGWATKFPSIRSQPARATDYIFTGALK